MVVSQDLQGDFNRQIDDFMGFTGQDFTRQNGDFMGFYGNKKFDSMREIGDRWRWVDLNSFHRKFPNYCK